MENRFQDTLKILKGGLIVSCQAPTDSPLHTPIVIAAMAQAAIQQGAVGVRIDTPAHIEAVRQRIQQPIIGLWKQQIPGCDVYITPQFHHAKAIAQIGADIIAIDATQRPRPCGEQLPTLIERIHRELNKPVMADIDTLESAQLASAAGADLIATTLCGYTASTRHCQPPALDLLSAISTTLSVPCLCEGGITSPDVARQAIARGAFSVVVGTAITGIDKLTRDYCKALPSASHQP